MSDKQTPHSQETRWYREPLAVFVFAIPAATVVAGLLTVWISLQAGDVRVNDSVNRFGMQATVEQNHD